LDKKIGLVSINGIEEKKKRYIKEDLIDVKNVFVKDFEKSSKKGVKIWKRQESLKQSNQMYYMNWINT